ncbi:PREDICTED: uncharacterized protein LOC104590753 [Nelumbo nucifera]|uniref:Uncharacterized protein LOC104590753 n=1 Tax=Nelumbo nucifera TaxID=4432 RepID=A0A1U7ZJ73_NELNU|nr:PREDICTED: uncharacterized protein LOC104590753 [Nelumbo nucifera]
MASINSSTEGGINNLGLLTLAATPGMAGSMPNITHYLPIKLNSDNYLLWHPQLLPILRNRKLMGIVEGKTPGHPKEIDDPEDLTKKIINPAFDHWYQLDQLLKRQLQSLKKGTLSISEYIQKAKGIADNLFVVSELVSRQDLVMCILSGLGSEYESIITTIANRVDFDKLRIANRSEYESMIKVLLNHESWLREIHYLNTDDSAFANLASTNKNHSQQSQQSHNNSQHISDRGGHGNHTNGLGHGRG